MEKEPWGRAREPAVKAGSKDGPQLKLFQKADTKQAPQNTNGIMYQVSFLCIEKATWAPLLSVSLTHHFNDLGKCFLGGGVGGHCQSVTGSQVRPGSCPSGTSESSSAPPCVTLVACSRRSWSTGSPTSGTSSRWWCLVRDPHTWL